MWAWLKRRFRKQKHHVVDGELLRDSGGVLMRASFKTSDFVDGDIVTFRFRLPS